ncbi:hypothetical protein OY671_012486, partial [Metschnikowia pulcherrima]
PALAAVSSRPHKKEKSRHPLVRRSQLAGDGFNERFDRFSARYGRLTQWSVARPKRVSVSYGGLVSATIGIFWVTPTGFIPAQDQSYSISITQSPPGASSARTDAVVQEVSRRSSKIDGIRGTIMSPGYDAASNTNSPNTATAFIPLKPF